MYCNRSQRVACRAASHTNVIAYPGQDVELTCDITGGTASWFINGLGPYSVSQLFSGTVTGYNSSGNNLIINDIVMNDPRNNYEYQCTTYSVNDGDLIFLLVAGVPKMVPVETITVTNVYLIRKNVTLTLSWGEPSHNYDPIVSYTVSCSGDFTCPPNFTTTDNTTRSYTITNLTTMTTYTFSVVATNSIGSGEAGLVAYSTPSGLPGIVPSVAIDINTIKTNENNVTLTISWKVPINSFDPIMNYTVSCSGGRCPPNFTTTDNTTRSYAITNLTTMTNYTFSVVATNFIGSGEAGVVMITTPPDQRNVISFITSNNNITTTSSVGMTTTTSSVGMTTTTSSKGMTTTTSSVGMTMTTSSEVMTTTKSSVVKATTIPDGCDNSILVGAVVGIVCTVIIIMVITNIMVWIYCFRKRHNSGISLELYKQTKDTIDKTYHNITDDYSEKQVEVPSGYYEEVIRSPEVKMTTNPAYAVP